LKTAKSHVANLLQVFSPKKKGTEQPSAAKEEVVRPQDQGRPQGQPGASVSGLEKGALFLDSAGKVVSVQPRCAGFFGRKPEELIRHHFKEFFKQPFDQEFANAQKHGKQSGVQSFPAVALRKDGTEFPTQVALKYLPGNQAFCWTAFVQAPPGYTGGMDHYSFKGRSNGLESLPPRHAKPTVATTETVTQGAAPEAELAEEPAARAGTHSPEDPLAEHAEKFAKQAQESSAESNVKSQTKESTTSFRRRAEDNETARKLLVADLEKVRNSNKLLRKKEEELNAQLQTLQAAVAQAESSARESAAQSKDWEKKAADLRNDIDELTRAQTAGQGENTQFVTRRIKDLELQLKDAKATVAVAKRETEKLEAKNQQLNEANTRTSTELDEEREANKLARQMAEELHTQIRKLQDAADRSETRARESAGTQSKNGEKKGADGKKIADELNQTRAELEEEREATKLARHLADELNAQLRKLQGALDEAEARARESVAQSKDWEQKAADLKKNVDGLTRGQATGINADAQSSQRVKELEQQLNEANAKAKAELEKERDAKNLSQKQKEELDAQVQKLKNAAEQAEARARESAAQSKDWEKKAADLKKNVDELTRGHATKNGDSHSAQRVKELEQRLNEANANLAETNAKAKADLEKERNAKHLSQQEKEELNAQVQKLKSAAEQAEARARESAAQSKDWEKKAADLKKNVDELTRSHAAGKNADAQSAQRIKELEQQLKDANASLSAGRTEAEKQNSAHQRLEAESRNLAEANAKAKADLEKERDAKKLSQIEKEKLDAQVQELKSAAEQAEARARECEARSKDWEKKAADLKNSIDELTRSHAAEKNAAAESAQRIRELEQQLNEANANLADGRAEAEKLEAENRQLNEAFDEERDATKLARQLAEELHTQVRKFQEAADQAKARARESAAQSRDWEKKAAELKKNVDEFTRGQGSGKNADAQSVQRVKELEQELREANASLAEANAKAKADLERERAVKNLLQEEKEELNAQVQELLTRSHTAGKNVDARFAQRVKELEQELDEANASLAAAEMEAEKLGAKSRHLNEANTRVRPDSTQSAERVAALERKLSELEERVREGLAKVDVESEGQRAVREQPGNCELSTAPQLLTDTGTEKLKELIEAFKLEGYAICKDGTHKRGVEKVVIYVKNGYPTHIARQLESGLWTSKCGLMQDVGHESHVERDVYGLAHTFMHRRRDGKPFFKDRLFRNC
jgi:chromosome segregation ATPase